MIHELYDAIRAALTWACKEGPLCKQNVMGVRLNLVRMEAHPDPIRRGAGQITLTAIGGAIKMAKPRLLEPVYWVEVQTNVKYTEEVCSIVEKRGGVLLGKEKGIGASCIITANIPVMASLGMAPSGVERNHHTTTVSYSFFFTGLGAELKELTKGAVAYTPIFHRFEMIPGGMP